MGIILTHSKNYHVSIVAMGIITAVSLAFTIVAAFPWVRNTHHKCVKWFGTLHVLSDQLVYLNVIIVLLAGGYLNEPIYIDAAYS